MNWFIILSIIGFVIVIFCIGYLFGLIKNKELDKKYFAEYKKDLQILYGYQPKYDLDISIPPKRGSNAVHDDVILEKNSENVMGPPRIVMGMGM